MTVRRHLSITGRVQGVFYRDWFVGEARAIGLDGWVRNRLDGSVEAVVQGTAEMVDRIIDLAHQGSPAARVDGVVTRDDVSDEILTGFGKRPTV